MNAVNTVEYTDVAHRAEPVETPIFEKAAVARQPARGRQCDAWVAYTLLAVIALLSAWLAFSINNSIDEIEAELEIINSNFASPLVK